MGKDNNTPLLHPILKDKTSLSKEYKLRNSDYLFKAVSTKNQDSYLEEGWVFDKKLKKKVRLKKLKPHDEQLENKFWCLLYRLGYTEMNQGRHFNIEFNRKYIENGKKQIDIFAKDDETVIIAECKSAIELKKKNLQKDIEAFNNSKKAFADTIKKHYGDNFKPKILWLFITENILWSSPDIDRAKAFNIRIITEKEYKYFKSLVAHLGPAARYQFLAEYLQGLSVPELANKSIPAIRGKLGGKNFYCFVTTPKQLLKISFINHRALDDPEGIPTYQRLVQRSRLKSIGDFIQKGGFFPTNFLVNFNCKLRFDISLKDPENDIHYGHLYLPDKYKSAWIIDGQHRLYGFSGLDDKFLKQNIMVLAFEKLPRHEEANLFVTINHEQKSVPRTLLDDLEGDLKWGSNKPSERIGSIASRLIKALNADLGKPFYNTLITQGIPATEDRTCLTVPEIKDGIRRSGLIGRSSIKKKVYEPGPLTDATDETTLQRAKEFLNEYFSLLRDANPTRWEKGRSGYLCTNSAIRAYLLLLAEIINRFETHTNLDAKELTTSDLLYQLIEFLDPIIKYISTTNDLDFEEQFKVAYGSGGPKQYFYKLCEIMTKKYPDFCPAGFQEWKESQSEEQITLADQRSKEINAKVQKYIFDKFKEIYGQDGNAYWERGITDVDMKTKAYKQSLQDPIEKRRPIETYLDFIDLKKIVEKKNNWPLFKDVFDIPSPKDKGQAKHLSWMDDYNSIRRVPAHYSYNRNYTPEDFQFLEWLDKELDQRLNQANTSAGSVVNDDPSEDEDLFSE